MLQYLTQWSCIADTIYLLLPYRQSRINQITAMVAISLTITCSFCYWMFVEPDYRKDFGTDFNNTMVSIPHTVPLIVLAIDFALITRKGANPLCYSDCLYSLLTYMTYVPINYWLYYNLNLVSYPFLDWARLGIQMTVVKMFMCWGFGQTLAFFVAFCCQWVMNSKRS